MLERSKEIYTEVELEIIGVEAEIKQQEKLLKLGASHPEYELCKIRIKSLWAALALLKKLSANITRAVEAERKL